MAIRLIAGLGNPGRKHERDRHNAGFWFVQRLAERSRAALRSEAKFQGVSGKIAAPTGEVWLLMPQTYMNASGRSVAQLARFYKLVSEEILVVHDELDFAPGTVRLKLGGGVTVSDVKARNVHVDTGSGRVKLDDVDSSTVYVDTGSGGGFTFSTLTWPSGPAAFA